MNSSEFRKQGTKSTTRCANEMRELSGQHDGAGTDCGGPDALEVVQPEYHSPDLNHLKIMAVHAYGPYSTRAARIRAPSRG